MRFPRIEDGVLWEIFQTLVSYKLPIGFHAENDRIINTLIDKLDQRAANTIEAVWQYTFYPYRLYLPLSQSDINRLNSDMPNLVPLPVPPSLAQPQRLDAVLDKCDSEYIAIVPGGLPIKDIWIENPLYALINNPARHVG